MIKGEYMSNFDMSEFVHETQHKSRDSQMGVEKLVLIEWNKENTREKVMLNMNDNRQHR